MRLKYDTHVVSDAQVRLCSTPAGSVPCPRLRTPCGRLKYEYVAFIGVGLTTADHFYSTLPAYADVREGVAAFESMATRFATHMYNTSMHATAGRGVYYFLEQLAIERRVNGQWLVNLAPQSLLASCKELPTVRLHQMAKCNAKKGRGPCVASLFERLGVRRKPSIGRGDEVASRASRGQSKNDPGRAVCCTALQCPGCERHSRTTSHASSSPPSHCTDYQV